MELTSKGLWYVKLYIGGYLPIYIPKHRSNLEISLKDTAQLKDLILKFGVPLDEVHLVLVNKVIVDLEDTMVEDQDEVEIYSSVAGG
jgi:sulfur carrier protein ThiS